MGGQGMGSDITITTIFGMLLDTAFDVRKLLFVHFLYQIERFGDFHLNPLHTW